MELAFVAAKGAPGVTATTMASAGVASAWQPTVAVELDPSGGDLMCWTAGRCTPTLPLAAYEADRDTEPEAVARHASPVSSGLWAIVAPTDEASASGLVAGSGERLAATLATLDRPVFVDGGRWGRAQPSARRIAAAAAVVVVCRPTIEGVEHARHLVAALRPVAQATAVVQVGVGPYRVHETHVGAPVAGVLVWEPKAIRSLIERGATTRWRRTGYARSVQSMLIEVERIALEEAHV